MPGYLVSLEVMGCEVMWGEVRCSGVSGCLASRLLSSSVSGSKKVAEISILASLVEMPGC